MAEPLDGLSVDGLTRRFGTLTALEGLTFSVAAGHVTGFLGANGTGKTTTMRAIFGLTELDAGSVTWRGSPVGAGDRRRFGYMPEERGLYPSMLVGVKGSTPLTLVATLVWLLAGYAFYCWIYAAVGSMAERQDQVQALAVPVSLLMVLGYVMASTVASSGSSSTFFDVLSYVPLTAPFAMPVLVGIGAVTWWQFAISLAISVVSNRGRGAPSCVGLPTVRASHRTTGETARSARDRGGAMTARRA